MGTTFDGDVHVMGRLTCGTFVAPSDSISDSAVGTVTPIAATKTVRRGRAMYSVEAATIPTAGTYPIHLAYADGIVKAFKVTQVLACLAGATVTVDLKKNGSTILSATVQQTDAHADGEVLSGALNGALDDYLADDQFTVVISVAAGGGTLAKGLQCLMVFDEQPS